MIAKILAPLAGILLLAGYAFAATYSTTSMTSLIPSPAAIYFEIETQELHLTPLTAEPNPCTPGTLYYNQTLDGLYLCDASNQGKDINAWLRTDGTPGKVSLKNGNDVIVNTGTYIGLSKGFNINDGTLAISKIAVGNTSSPTDLAILGRGNTALLYNPQNGSLRVGTNVLIGSLGAYNPYSVVFGTELVTDPTASYISVLGGSNHTVSGTISHAVIAGGDRNTVMANLGTIAGGNFNSIAEVSGFVGGGTVNRILSGGRNAVIGGGDQNTIASGGTYAFIGGGSLNSVSGDHAALVGGGDNSASGTSSFIGGGGSNRATGNFSAIPGGSNNTASGSHAFALGGANTVSGDSSGAFGNGHTVSGSNSFAVGSGGNVAGNNTAVFQGVSVAVGRNDVRGGGTTVNLDLGNGEIVANDRYVPTTGTFSEILRFKISGCSTVTQASHSGISAGDLDANGTCDVTFPMTFEGTGLHTPTCNVFDPSVSKHGYVVITNIIANGFSFVTIDPSIGGPIDTVVVCIDIGQKNKTVPFLAL